MASLPETSAIIFAVILGVAVAVGVVIIILVVAEIGKRAEVDHSPSV